MSDPHDDPSQSAPEPAAVGHAPAAARGGHGEDAAHAGAHGQDEALGPIDWVAWGAGVLGVVVGLGMALAFAIATNRFGA